MVRVSVCYLHYILIPIRYFKQQAFVIPLVKINAQTLVDVLLKLTELQNVSVTEGWSWMLMVSLAMVWL
jgi:hypothetical protein